MKIYGNAGQAITCENEQPFEGFATSSGRDILTDLQRKHAAAHVHSPMQLKPLAPAAERALVASRAPRKPPRPPAPRLARPTRPVRADLTPKPPRPPKPPRVPRPPVSRRPDLDRDVIVAAYRDGLTPPQLAEKFGTYPRTIREMLRRAGVELRDDRATRSGSKPKQYDASLVTTVRRLYSSGMSQLEVASYCQTTPKVIQRLMVRHGIEARPAVARPQNAGDHAQDHRGLVTSLGGSAAIREWADRNGINCPRVGLPPTAVVDAYLEQRQAAS